MCRFTRLTNAFRRKAENHAYTVAIRFTWYYCAKIHQILRIEPRWRLGVANLTPRGTPTRTACNCWRLANG